MLFYGNISMSKIFLPRFEPEAGLCVFYVIIQFLLCTFALLYSFWDLLKNEKMYIYRKTSK